MKYPIIGLTLEDFEVLYNSHLLSDFPRAELRSMETFEEMYNDEAIYAYAMVDEDEILAYATFVREKSSDVMLLDYYAVSKTRRNEGLGSLFLQELRILLPARGFILEVEDPNFASNDQELDIRNRRVDFYKRNGATMTDWMWHAFTVDFKLMWMPVNEDFNDQNNLGNHVRDLYYLIFDKELVDDETRIKKEA